MPRLIRRLMAGAMVILFAQPQASADTAGEKFIPNIKPALTVVKATGAVKIDGKLDEAGWKQAAVADNFAESYPGDQTKPPVATKALISYSDDYLYVAFVCHDDPGDLRASFSERDKIDSDDKVCVRIDTQGDASWAYYFYVNPNGIQSDAMWASVGGEDKSFDVVWASAGIVTDSGYQVEMAIPFAALRFPRQDKQTWRMDFWRNRPRETSAEFAWVAYDRNENCIPCQWGTVSGIDGVTPGRGIEAIGSVVGFQSGSIHGDGTEQSPYNLHNERVDGNASLGAKMSFRSSATLEATINPDFSQIESDAGQIDVNTTFAIFYPEHRPFFQEGNDLFRTRVNAFYSRMINDPDIAVKGIARIGRTSIAYLAAKDNNSPFILPSEERSDMLEVGKSWSNVLRVKRTLGPGSDIGLLLTDRRLEIDGSGTTLSLDGNLRLAPTVRASFHFAASHTKEFTDSVLSSQIYAPEDTFSGKYTRAFDGESYAGHAVWANLTWWTSTWNVSNRYWESSQTFRQDNGYSPQNNFRRDQTTIGYNIRPKSGLFETINPHFRTETVWNFDGVRKDQWVTANMWTMLRYAQASTMTTYKLSRTRFRDVQYDGLWSIYQDAFFQFADEISLTGTIQYGHLLAKRYRTKGRLLDLSAEVVLKPHPRVAVDETIQYAKGNDLQSDEGLYDGYIWRSRVSYQMSRPLTVRLITEYDHFYKTWAIDPLITYRLSPFSVFYLGSSSRYEELPEEMPDGNTQVLQRLTSRQFFVKLQYLFAM